MNLNKIDLTEFPETSIEKHLYQKDFFQSVNYKFKSLLEDEPEFEVAVQRTQLLYENFTELVKDFELYDGGYHLALLDLLQDDLDEKLRYYSYELTDKTINPKQKEETHDES